MNTQRTSPYDRLLEFLTSIPNAMRTRQYEDTGSGFNCAECWLINSRVIIVIRDREHGGYAVFLPANESLEIDADINTIKKYCEV